MHHLQALRALQLGELATNFNVPLGAVGLVGRLVSLLGVLLLPSLQNIQCLLHSRRHLVLFEISIWVVLEEDFMVIVLFVFGCLLLAFFNPFGDFGLGEFFIGEGFLLFG